MSPISRLSVLLASACLSFVFNLSWAQCPNDEVLIAYNVTLGEIPEDIEWLLLNEDEDIVFNGGAGTAGTWCLKPGSYRFIGLDYQGDGWNGAEAQISYPDGPIIAVFTLVDGGEDGVVFDVANFGCTSSEAANFDPAATVDDGTCCFEEYITVRLFDSFGDGWSHFGQWGGFILNGDSVEFEQGTYDNTEMAFPLCLEEGCYTAQLAIPGYPYEASWVVEANGDAYAGGSGNSDPNPTFTFVVGNPSPNCLVPGCTDDGACNFDALANVDNGSCEFETCLGCTIPEACNYDPDALIPDGSCVLGGTSFTNVLTGLNQGEAGIWSIHSANGGERLFSSWETPADEENTDNFSFCMNPGCYFLYYFGYAGTYAVVVDGDTLVDGAEGVDFDANYSPLDDDIVHSFCIGDGIGCTNPEACNFNPNATTPGECDYSCLGCTSPFACNYDETAVVDDGSCFLCLENCFSIRMLDSNGDGWNNAIWTLTSLDNNVGVDSGTLNDGLEGTEWLCVPDGCYAFSVSEGDDPEEIQWEVLGSDENIITGSAGQTVTLSFGGLNGCTNAGACNYNDQACNDDGSCVFQLGCTDEEACNYNSQACIDDGSCQPGPCGGCTDALAVNFNPNADYDNGSCLFAGCSDPAACNYNAEAVGLEGCLYANGLYDCNLNCYNDADGDGICDELEVLGCTDPNACNYNSAANEDDGSCATLSGTAYVLTISHANDACVYSVEVNNAPAVSGSLFATEHTRVFCTDEEEPCIVVSASSMNAEGISYTLSKLGAEVLLQVEREGRYGIGPCQGYGCALPSACNFDAGAIVNDGSCEFDSCAGCLDPQACNFDYTASLADQSLCDYNCIDQAGCMNAIACNFNPYAIVDDGSCDTESCRGCMDVGACNYDPLATLPDVCDHYSCLGCTDNTACNFESSASIDDGTCSFSCTGCDDPTASNYCPTCTSVDNSLCVFCGDALMEFVIVDDFGDGFAAGGTYSIQVDGVEVISGNGAFGFGETHQFCVEDPNSCIAVVMNGDIFAEWENLWTLTNLDNGSVILEGTGAMGVYGTSDCASGCINPVANNFNPSAVVNDFSCVEVLGCTIPFACNFNAFATVDDGTCSFCENNCFRIELNDAGGDGWNGAVWSLLDQATGAGIDGGTLVNGIYSIEAPCLEDGCYTFSVTAGSAPNEVSWTLDGADGGLLTGFAGESVQFSVGGLLGCTNSQASNYDPIACTDDGSCLVDNGCTDSLACNYNPMAVMNDGSCVYPQGVVYGCTNVNSSNYDAEATHDDGTCDLSFMCSTGTTYDANFGRCVGVSDCPGDLDGDGQIGTTDLLEFLAFYGNSCP